MRRGDMQHKSILISIGFCFLVIAFWQYWRMFGQGKIKPDSPENKIEILLDQNVAAKYSSSINSPVTLHIRPEIKAGFIKLYNKPIEQVVAEYKLRLENNLQDAEAHLELGKIYGFCIQTHKQALYHLESGLKLKPDHPSKASIQAQIDVYKMRDHGFVNLRKTSSSEKIAKEAGEEELKLAQKYEAYGEKETAQKYYQRALRLNPKNSEIHLMYANFCMKHNLKEALNHFEMVLQLKPEHPKKIEIEKWIKDLKQELAKQGGKRE